MIQRPQTLFIFAALLCSIFTIFQPICSYDLIMNGKKSDLKLVVKASGVYGDTDNETLKEHRNDEAWQELNNFLNEELSNQELAPLFKMGLGGFILFSLFILGIVFLYNRRTLQFRLCILAAVMSIAISIVFWIGSIIGEDILTARYENEINVEFNMTGGFYLIIVTCISMILASYFIKKDINLLKNMDRLR